MLVYTSSDWVRAAQKPAGDASMCAEIFLSIPPLAADKTRFRVLQDDAVRAVSLQIHPVAEIQRDGLVGLGHVEQEDVVRGRGRSLPPHEEAGYVVEDGEIWAVNEFSSAVRRGDGNARANMRQFVRGLHDGAAGMPGVRGAVFVVGLDQRLADASVYKATLKGFLADSDFWADMLVGALLAQETYSDSRSWGVVGLSRAERAGYMNDYLQHLVELAESGPEEVETARSYLREAHLLLASAAWPWKSAFGDTDLSVEQMQHFVSTQTFSIRHYAGSHPHRAPGERIGFAYAPNLAVAGPELTAGTGLILDRLASSLHHSYDRGGGSQVGACGPPASTTGASRSGSTRCSTSRGGCSRPGTGGPDGCSCQIGGAVGEGARLPPLAGRAGRQSVERDHAADPVLRLHQLEAVVHVVEREPVVDQRLDAISASQRSISTGTWSRPFTPPNDEPATRRPVIRTAGRCRASRPCRPRPRPCRGPSPCARTRRPARPARCRSPRRCSRRRSRRWTRRSASTTSSPPVSVSVAPWWRARPSRSSERSTQAIRPAPARRQPITAPSPTRPAPNTTHVDPGSTFAVLSAAPIPVERPQAKSAAPSSGAFRADLRERDLRHDRALREGRGAHEVPHRLAVPRETGRAVREVALVLLLADGEAEVRPGSGSARTRGTAARRA